MRRCEGKPVLRESWLIKQSKAECVEVVWTHRDNGGQGQVGEENSSI